MPEGEEEEQEIENLFEKKNERKLPQFGKGNRHKSPGGTESLKQVGPKEAHTNIIIMLPKIKDKERILEAAKRKGHSYLQRSSHKTIN